MPFDLVDLEVLPPLFAEDFPALAVDLEVVFALLPPLLLDEALFDFDDAGDFESLFAVLPVVAPPALFDLADEDFLPPPSSKSPTASAAMLSALTAAPVAAPVRISVATSAALSKTGDAAFFTDFFVVDFDFAEVFAKVFAGAEVFFAPDFDLAGVAVFLVDFSFSFFVAIFHLPL